MTDPLIPLNTVADVVAAVDDLVGPAIRRQTWVLLLDDDQRLVQPLVPMDGVPVDPDPHHIDAMADRVRMLIEAVPDAVAAIVVWERPGSARVRLMEADWMVGLAATDAPIRVQLIASDDGAQVVDPAFAALVAE